jgi:hypothetical protein
MSDARTHLFIIGAPRSGTTMLQILLGNHPAVATTVELTLFDKYLKHWLAAWAREQADIRDRGWKQGLPMIWSEAEFDDFAREFLCRAYAKVVERRADATHILDKHPGYALHTAAIRRFIPGARFIHLIRDGRDVACSLVAARAQMGFGFERLAEAGGLWRQMVLAAREASTSENYLEVRYEDLTGGSSRDACRRVLAFSGLVCDEPWLDRTLADNTFDKMKDRGTSADAAVKLSSHFFRRGKAGAWTGDFTARDRYEFELAAGDLLRELGYAHGDWWVQDDADRWREPARRWVHQRTYHAQLAFDAFAAVFTGRLRGKLGELFSRCGPGS